MIYEYKLSDDLIEGDLISINILKRRKKLYRYIKEFSLQKSNNGVFAENIMRLIFDGINLNHLAKNHPHVDIAILNPIKNITKKNEIISVKSSIEKKLSISKLVNTTKAIKLESMFSYVLFAHSNFDIHFRVEYPNPQKILRKGREIISNGNNKDYKAMVNTTLYYLFNEVNNIENYYDEDMSKISNGDYNLKFGDYKSYRFSVLRELTKLSAPISLGVAYIDGKSEELTYVIKKTNDVPLNRYWEDLVEIWLKDSNFESEKEKYLRLSSIKNLFEIKADDDLPIEIRISIGDFKLDNNIDYSKLSKTELNNLSKRKVDNKAKKLYVATRFQDADFQERQDEVDDYFIDTIDKLEDNPNLIDNFLDFTNKLG